MDQTIYGCCRGHRILEDLVPLREDQVTGDDDAPSLISLSEESEKDFHLLGRLLNIADVIENDHLEGVELPQCPGELQLSFGNQKVLNQLECRDPQHRVPSLDQGVSQSRRPVTLARPRQSEGQYVDRPIGKVSTSELGQFARQ